MEGGGVKATLLSDFHRDRRTFGGGRADYHDRRGIRFPFRSVIRTLRYRTESASGGRCGAGMSAIFGTPLAAIMLALELLLFEWKPRSLVPVAIASITAGIARYFLLGAPPIFPVIHHPVLSPSTLACIANWVGRGHAAERW